MKNYTITQAAKIFILNDLFVMEEERGKGYGKILAEAVLMDAKQNDCIRVSLSTARNNPAQHLYEKLGFSESSFKFYNFNFIY